MANHNDSIIEIPEYRSKNILGLNVDKDIPYLKKECFKYNTLAPYKIRELQNKYVEIENSSYSGIVQLDKYRLHFSTKVKTNLFYMLSFLKDEKCFLYDPDIIIDIKEGANFFDILGRLYLNELEEIIRKGIYKKYVRRQENKAFLKGKLNINGQIINDIRKRPKFYCSFEDLTFDNLENRIILRAAILLIPLIRFNEDIKCSLNRYSQQLQDEIALVDITPEDCNKIQFNKMNENYEAIIQLAKVIIQYCFIRSVHPGLSKGFNFVVNMNQVYEDFITELVREVIEEDEAYDSFVVDKQIRFDTLVKEKRIVTRPDIILRKKDTDEYPIIIDAKYKRQENNADYYQVIAYALAIPSSKVCCLIYPSEENIDDTPLTLQDFSAERKKIKLFPIHVDLGWEKNWDFENYVINIKSQLGERLARIF